MPMSRRATVSVASAAAIALLAVVAAIVVTPSTHADAAATRPSPASTPISLTFAGDSVTHRPHSWMRQLDDPTIRDVGGVSIDGATSGEVLAHMVRRPADVLVVMLGVNDVRLGVDPAVVASHIRQIAARSGARHVVLSAIAPSDRTDYGPGHLDRRALGAALNRDLEALAADQDWEWIDPFAGYRTIDNGWSHDASVDGVHPSDAVSSVVRDRVEAAVHVADAGAAA